MNPQTYKKINATKTIEANIPRIIEAFVTYYGESERENIEAKFKNLLVIGYCKPKDLERMINKDKKQKSEELIKAFLDKLNISLEKQPEMKKVYFDDFEFEYAISQPINKCIRYLNGTTVFKKDAIKIAQTIYPEASEENIDELISSGKLSQLNEIIKLYNETINQYNKYEENFQEYEEYIKQCSKIQEDLKLKYEKILVSEFSYLFKEDELKEIEENYNKKYPTSLNYINNKTKCYFGSNLTNTALIDSFSTENSELLENGREWQIKSITNDRIKFFKLIGIDLENDYEAYLNHPEVKKIFDGLQQLADKMIESKKELHTRMMNEYYQSLPEYKYNVARIEQAGLLDKEHGYNANAYEQTGTMITTNIKLTENGYIMYPVMLISTAWSSEYLDATIIHELNHVYELNLSEVTNNKYYGTCGWDLVDGEINNQAKDVVSLEKNTEKRNYELMNEIVNELISQEITTILFESNGYIFNTKEDAKIKGGTSYENTKFLISTFYETYKKEIIESRKNGNLSVLFDTVVKENLEALNELFNIFYKEFTIFSFADAIRDIKKGIQTEKTKILNEIVNKRDEILIRMEEHSKKQTQSM